MQAAAGQPAQPGPRRPLGLAGGFTLAELVTSMAASSILFAAIGSAVYLSSHALPRMQDPTQRSSRAAMVMDELAADLQTASYISEHTAHAIAFVVEDRAGAAKGTRIRYAWSGKAGDPLTRQIDDGPPVTLLENVHDFYFDYGYQEQSDTYAHLPVTDPFESLLVNYDPVNDLRTHEIRASDWYGQYFEPVLPPDAVGWQATRLKVRLIRHSAAGSATLNMFRAGSNLTPSGSALASTSISGSNLSDNPSWEEYAFSNLPYMEKGEGLCMTLEHVFGNPAMRVEYDHNGPAGQLRRGGLLSSWSYHGGRRLRTQLYGYLTRIGPDVPLPRTYLAQARVQLHVHEHVPPLLLDVPLLNQPELLKGYWRLDFDRDPTAIDVNGDGINDWATANGSTFPVSTLQQGVWKADRAIDIRPVTHINQLTTFDLRMRATSAGRHGPALLLIFDRGPFTAAGLIVYMTNHGNGVQSLTLGRVDGNFYVHPLVRVEDLPEGFADARLVIAPGDRIANLTVNGTYAGTVQYSRQISLSIAPLVRLYPVDQGAEFEFVQVRISESP